ncbi:MAG: hypothetical protein ACRCWI_04820 [Brevinema sp.]
MDLSTNLVTFLGVGATFASAIAMFCTVCKMSEQNKLSAESTQEIKNQSIFAQFFEYEKSYNIVLFKILDLRKNSTLTENEKLELINCYFQILTYCNSVCRLYFLHKENSTIVDFFEGIFLEKITIFMIIPRYKYDDQSEYQFLKDNTRFYEAKALDAYYRENKVKICATRCHLVARIT